MEFTLYELLISFLLSLVLGLCLALLYEPVRFFHKLGFDSTALRFATDFLYILFFALATFFFCLAYLKGGIRSFVVIGELCGFFVFVLTARPVLDRFYNPIIKLIKNLSEILLKKVRRILYNIKNRGQRVIKEIANLLSKVKVYEQREHKSFIKRTKRNKRNKPQA